MSYRIIVTDHAHKDLRQIMLWYNEQQKNFENDFISRAEELISRLAKNPLIYQVRKKGFGMISLTSSPYLALYEIIKQDVGLWCNS